MSTPEPASDVVRTWLLRNPRPTTVRVVSRGGEERDYTIPTRRPRWRTIADELLGYDPVFLEALGPDDQSLRPLRLDAQESSEALPERPATPELPSALQGDPQSALLAHYATLLSQAYRHTTDVAFDKLLALVERMDRRTDSLESRLENSERRYQDEVYDRIQDMLDAAEEQGGSSDARDEIAKTFLGAVHQGKKPRKAG